jgi:hypothetical protein
MNSQQVEIILGVLTIVGSVLGTYVSLRERLKELEVKVDTLWVSSGIDTEGKYSQKRRI